MLNELKNPINNSNILFSNSRVGSKNIANKINNLTFLSALINIVTNNKENIESL